MTVPGYLLVAPSCAPSLPHPPLSPQVTDPNNPGSGWTYNPSQAAANGTTQLGSQLACSEFQHCSSFNGDGVEFTGDNGFTVDLRTHA